MQEVKVYDETRKPVSWVDMMQPHQYAIFLQHVKMETPLTTDGQPLTNELNGTCLIFDSLAEAQEYARARVAQTPLTAYYIFDCRGKVGDPIDIILDESQRSCLTGTSLPIKDIYWGTFFFIGGLIIVFAVEVWTGWQYVYGLLLGSKPITFGLCRLCSGISKLVHARRLTYLNEVKN